MRLVLVLCLCALGGGAASPPSRSVAAGSVAAGSVAAGSVAAGSVAAGSVAAGSVAAGFTGAYRVPVSGAAGVINPFDPPARPYGPGHLGVDLAGAPADPVLAAAAGIVAFSGRVAGRGVVVVLHPDGVRTEYEPLAPAVRAGARVAAGGLLGWLEGHHAACAPRDCLHWGARRGPVYVDPLSLLRPLGPVHLLPWRRGA